MPPHSLTNFEVQKYYQNEPEFNGVYSKNNLPRMGHIYIINLDEFNPIQDVHFRSCSRMEEEGGAKRPPLPKICHTYPTMIKLGTVIPYLKKLQKIYESRDTPPDSTDISIFSPENTKVCYMKKYKYRLHFGP